MITTTGIQLACFMVGPGQYAADILQIKEIILCKKIVSVPRAPDFMEGIINLRGKIIPVIDMHKRLDIPVSKNALQKKARIMIVSIDTREIGIIVDSVDDVITVEKGDIDNRADLSSDLGTEYIQGVAKYDDEMIMILNIQKLLTSKEKISLGNINNIVKTKKAKKAPQGDQV
ncbi:MAG: purine-binding chemotaxis protein CheW [Deltaproteobacteria bacterium]|nr:purine-binding chemotaxis protein CheW [Deltaproteobacteria bacterium]